MKERARGGEGERERGREGEGEGEGSRRPLHCADHGKVTAVMRGERRGERRGEVIRRLIVYMLSERSNNPRRTNQSRRARPALSPRQPQETRRTRPAPSLRQQQPQETRRTRRTQRMGVARRRRLHQRRGQWLPSP